ncbi:NlpC/P60 family protein [Crossiella sp. CA198]|uniref:C40 family peptidase n=1 Tax=Crossiella sp. CA198 TaxID=3455607 RepID=UPI003F8D6F17
MTIGVATLVSAPTAALAAPADQGPAATPPVAPPVAPPALAPVLTPADQPDALAAEALARVAETQRRLTAVETELTRFDQTLRAGDLKAARLAIGGVEKLCADPLPALPAQAVPQDWAGVVAASADRLQREHLRRREELCASLPQLAGRLAEAQLRQRMERVAAALPALKAGSRDAESVGQLKTLLTKATGAKLSPKNPSYGPSTTAAVREFQAKRSLPVTGRADKLTWRELLVANGGPLTPAVFSGKAAPTERAAAAVRAALSQLGLPYEWGAVKPGESFDCSGLTSWAYRQAGVTLPRHSTDQAVGSPVAREDLRPGDLIVWQGHVAMYVDKGRMIEAGDPVRLTALRTSNVGMPFLGFFRPTA